MELHIDTAKDSKEEIQKVILFLQQWVDSQGLSQPSQPMSFEVPQQVSAPVQDNIFSLLNDDTPQETVQKKDPVMTPDFPMLSSLGSLDPNAPAQPKAPKPSYRIETYD